MSELLPSEASSAPCFVLVHGAWHGGWCWAPVARRLEARGWRCYAPTLTGMAHRAPELTPEVSADTHAQDIIALIEALDLRRVVLVLHSYAGLLGPALLARLRERLLHIAWIEAVIPPPGAAMLELTLPEAAQRYRTSAAENGEGWWMPPPDVAQFRLADAALAAQVGTRLTRQPLRSFSEPLRLPQQEVFGFPGSVLVASDRVPAPYARYVAQARAAGWPMREVPGGHLLMLSNPDAVTGFLADIAAGQPERTPVMKMTPQLHHIDHLTLRVHPHELPALRDFYATVLGLHEGWRPAFDFPGHWLYAAERPVVHLAGNAPDGEGAPDAALPTGKFNHVSFRSTGLAAMRAHLRALGVAWREAPVPGARLHQIFLHDPVGLKVELTYDQAELEAAGVAEGIEREY